MKKREKTEFTTPYFLHPANETVCLSVGDSGSITSIVRSRLLLTKVFNPADMMTNIMVEIGGPVIDNIKT